MPASLDDLFASSEPAAPVAASGASMDDLFAESKTSGAGSFLRGAAQELSFGFADEIAGGVESLFGNKKYKQARDESRANYATAEADNPGLYTAGQVTGGLASLAIPGGAIGKAVGTGAKVARAAGAGAAYGAGHSTAEDLGGLAKDTAIGGVAGAGLYGAGKLVGAAGKKALSVAPELLKNAMANRILGAAGGMITGAIGGGGVTGSVVGAGLGMLAPSAGKLIKRAFGGKAAGKAAGAIERLELEGGAKAARTPSGALLAPAAKSPIKDFVPEVAPPAPVGTPRAAQDAYKAKVQEGYQDAFAKQGGRPKVVADGAVDLAPVATPARAAPPALPRDVKGRFLRADAPARKIAHPAPEGMADLKAQLEGNAKSSGIPKDDQSTVEALRNVISSRSREGNIPGLKHYPQSPTKAFQGYLDDLPKSTGGTAKAQKDALVKLVMGVKHSGGDPGLLVYRARAAGVPDKAIMRAVGFGPQGGGVPKGTAAAAESGTVNIRAGRPAPSPAEMADGPGTVNIRGPGAAAPPVAARNSTKSLASPAPASTLDKPWTDEEFHKGIAEAGEVWNGRLPGLDAEGGLIKISPLQSAVMMKRMAAESRGEYPKTQWFGKGR